LKTAVLTKFLSQRTIFLTLSQVDKEPLLFSNWEMGKPNHASGANNERCVQMNWRSKQSYQGYIKLGKDKK